MIKYERSEFPIFSSEKVSTDLGTIAIGSIGSEVLANLTEEVFRVLRLEIPMYLYPIVTIYTLIALLIANKT